MAITASVKECSLCRETKPLFDFYAHPTATHGRRPECKRCRNHSEIERRRSSSKARQLARDATQRWRYKLEPLDRAALLAAQDGGCAICQTFAGRMVVDHEHASGRVRGILCDSCNVALGHFRDDPVVLAEAIGYLGATLPVDLYPLIRRNSVAPVI